VEVRSDNVLVVKNSALKWTATWLFCFVLLFVPAIFFLSAASNQTVDGSTLRVPTWVGAVLLTFAMISFFVLLPFTIVTNTRMDKNLDSFKQEHQILNCIPCSCYSSSEFALSEIVNIRVESFEENFDQADESDDRAQFSFAEGEDEYFEARYGVRARSQVVVYFQDDSRPITTFTTGAPSCLQMRSSRMTAGDIKAELDSFLGLEVNVLGGQDSSQHTGELDSVAPDELRAGEEGGLVPSLHAGVGQLETPMGGVQVMEVPTYVRPRRNVVPLLGEVGAKEAAGKSFEREEGMAYIEADTTTIQPYQTRNLEELEVEKEPALPTAPTEERAYPKKKKKETEEERKVRKALKKKAIKDETPNEREARRELKKSKKKRGKEGRAAAGAKDGAGNHEGVEEDKEGRSGKEESSED